MLPTGCRSTVILGLRSEKAHLLERPISRCLRSRLRKRGGQSSLRPAPTGRHIRPYLSLAASMPLSSLAGNAKTDITNQKQVQLMMTRFSFNVHTAPDESTLPGEQRPFVRTQPEFVDGLGPPRISQKPGSTRFRASQRIPNPVRKRVAFVDELPSAREQRETDS